MTTEMTMEPLESVAPIANVKTNLDLINECDNFPYHEITPLLYSRHVAHYYTFRIPCCPSPLGFVLPTVAHILNGIPGWDVDDDSRTLTLIEGSNVESRSAAIARTCEAMKETKYFQVLEGWRDELYPIYGEVVEEKDLKKDAETAENEGEEAELELEMELQKKRRNTELLCTMERAATALFGIVTYGCHMTAYTYTSEPSSTSTDTPSSTSSKISNLKIWVPRRSATKQTYSSMLDNTVAGGISAGEQPFESLVRECGEEASLPENLVRRKARAVGTVTYFHVRDSRAGGETGLLMPECQFVYDLDLTGEKAAADEKEIQPKPSDDEVEGFSLMSVDDVKAALGKGEFKPNCALVLLDFFVRHGVLTPEGERDYAEVVSRLHRRFGFPMG